MITFSLPSPVQKLESSFLKEKQIDLLVKRDDLIHEKVSGNKWRKLKYHLELAKNNEHTQLLTFGGAYSNHLLATSVAGNALDFKTIGVIRGEEPEQLSETLLECKKYQMTLQFVSRADYNRKTESQFIEDLEGEFGKFYTIPEGGAGTLGEKGCGELLNELSEEVDFICCAAGTGTTAAGIAHALHQEHLLIFPALKGMDFKKEDSFRTLDDWPKRRQIHFVNDYHFGGYAKLNKQLVDFVNDFYTQYDLKLDLVYTAKLFFGVFDLIEKGFFSKGSRLLLIHSGGLQGNRGMQSRFKLQLFGS